MNDEKSGGETREGFETRKKLKRRGRVINKRFDCTKYKN